METKNQIAGSDCEPKGEGNAHEYDPAIHGRDEKGDWKEMKWKIALKKHGDNPNYIIEQIEALRQELRKDYPYVIYLREKVKNINLWVDEIEKFN